jgi:ATP-dependent DNA ligase
VQDLTPGQPARPMLAAVASSVEYAHSKLHGHAAVVETKFDGERMQVGPGRQHAVTRMPPAQLCK